MRNKYSFQRKFVQTYLHRMTVQQSGVCKVRTCHCETTSLSRVLKIYPNLAPWTLFFEALLWSKLCNRIQVSEGEQNKTAIGKTVCSQKWNQTNNLDCFVSLGKNTAKSRWLLAWITSSEMRVLPFRQDPWAQTPASVPWCSQNMVVLSRALMKQLVPGNFKEIKTGSFKFVISKRRHKINNTLSEVIVTLDLGKSIWQFHSRHVSR